MDPVATGADDSLQGRMIRAARLDPTLYEEVRDDSSASMQALWVVLLTALATGIGYGNGDVQLIAKSAVFALLGWLLSAQLAWIVGTRLLAERSPERGAAAAPTGGEEPRRVATPAQLLRTIGFANAPGLVRLIAVIPEFRVLAFVATTAWILFATVIAIREGLAFRSTARAATVYLVIQILAVPLVLLFAPPGEEAKS